MDNVIKNKNNKPAEASSETRTVANTRQEYGFFTRIGRAFGIVFNYGYASLKVVDVVARICTAAALYLKLDETILNWGAGFLAATAVWEIVVALLRAYGPNRKQP